MTTEQEYAAGYAKSSSIRNTVLRYLHRDMTQLVFARVYGGNVSKTELNVIWYLLNKKGFDYGTLFTLYVDRITKKDGGVICSGGLITAIAKHLGISLAGLTEDMGERFITYEVLFSVGLLKTDYLCQGYILQVEGITFPFQSRNRPRSTFGQIKPIGSSTLPPTEEPLRLSPSIESLGGRTFILASPSLNLKMTPPLMQLIIMRKRRSMHMLKEVECHHRRRPDKKKKKKRNWRSIAAGLKQTAAVGGLIPMMNSNPTPLPN